MIDTIVASTNPNHDFISFFYLNIYLFSSKLVYAFGSPQEHDFKFFSFWVTIEILAKCLVYMIVFL